MFKVGNLLSELRLTALRRGTSLSGHVLHVHCWRSRQVNLGLGCDWTLHVVVVPCAQLAEFTAVVLGTADML